MKVLFLSPLPLDKRNDGVKIRGGSLLDALRHWAEVEVVCFQEDGRGDVPLPARPGRPERLFSLEPSLFRCFRSDKFRELVQTVAPAFDLCFCLGLQMSQYLDCLPRGMPVLLDNFNVESDILVGLARRRRGLKRLYWLLQAWKLRRYEKRALSSVKLSLAISEQDQQRFDQLVPGVRVECVPPGLNLQPYLDASGEPRPGRLVFVGALDWHVNVDAVQWMARDVLPLVRTQRPQAELYIVGRRPTSEVADLARLPGVSLLSDVPSVVPFLAESQAVVVPLRFGSGVQTKVIEAMAAGRPVVTTPIGFEGLNVVAGQDLLVADEASQFAECCLQLILNQEESQVMGWRGREAVRIQYGDQRLREDIRRILRMVAGEGR